MANGESGPYIIWRNPARAEGKGRRDWFASKAANGSYEVRQQLDSGRWALVAIFTIMRRAAAA